LTKSFSFLILLVTVLLFSDELHAQVNNRAIDNKNLFAPKQSKTRNQGPVVNPVRKIMNMFNLSFEVGASYFTHQQELTDVLLVRTEDPIPLLYIIPAADESSTIRPYNGFNNWFNDFSPLSIGEIHDDDLKVRTTSNPITYENSGSYVPIAFRLSFSIKKLDKQHYKITGDRRQSEDDMVRIGGGIGFGKMRYRNAVMTPSLNEPIGTYHMPFTKVSQNKMFGSIDINVYSKLDFTMFLNLEAGTWQFKKESFNQEYTVYDPFYSIGITFEKTVSKYFKLYMRPAVELREFKLTNGQINVTNKVKMFSINFGALLKYPTYPRNKFSANHVQMEHIFNGKKYRGRPFYKKQNPRIGQNMPKQKKTLKKDVFSANLIANLKPLVE